MGAGHRSASRAAFASNVRLRPVVHNPGTAPTAFHVEVPAGFVNRQLPARLAAADRVAGESVPLRRVSDGVSFSGELAGGRSMLVRIGQASAG